MANEVKIRISAKDDASQIINKVEDSMSSFSSNSKSYFEKVTKASREFATGFAIVTGVVTGIAIKYGDSVQSLSNKVLSMSKNQAEANDTFNKLVEIAQRSRSPLDSTISAFQRFQLTNQSLGIGMEQTYKMVETVNKGLQLSGAATGEASAAMLQLAQAYASGRLQGDEFRSLSETFPTFMIALQKSLGVSTSELKKMGQEGLITRDVMAKALEGMADDTERKFKDMPVTIGQAFTGLNTTILKAFKDINEQTGVFDKIAKAIQDMGTWLSSVTPQISGFINALKPEYIFIFAGAITAALIPSLISAGIAAGGFLVSIAPLLGIGALIAASLVLLKLAWDTNFLGIQDKTKAVVDFITQKFEELKNYWDNTLKPALTDLWTKIQEIWGLIRDNTTEVWDAIKVYFEKLWKAIGDVIDAGLKVIGDLFNIFGDLFTGNWTKLWEDIKQLGSDLWNLIGVTIQAAWDIFVANLKVQWAAFKTIFGALWEAVKKIATDAWNGIGKAIQDAWGTIVKWVTVDAKSAIEGAFHSMMGGLAGIAKGILNSVIATFEGFINTAVDGINALIDAANAVSPIKVGRVSHVSIGRLFRGGIVGEGLNGGMPLQAFATGGVVNGPAGIDKVPILATAGEIVLNRAQQGRLATQLEGGGGISISLVITGNNFYGDDETFTQRIGNTIIDELKKHIDFESF